MNQTLKIMYSDFKLFSKKYYTNLIYYLYFMFEKFYRFLYLNIRKLYYHAENKRLWYNHKIIKNNYDIKFQKVIK